MNIVKHNLIQKKKRVESLNQKRIRRLGELGHLKCPTYNAVVTKNGILVLGDQTGNECRFLCDGGSVNYGLIAHDEKIDGCFVKFGISTTVESRMSALATGLPFKEMTCVIVHAVPTRRAETLDFPTHSRYLSIDVEKYLHETNEVYRSAREWFHFEDGSVSRVVDKVWSDMNCALKYVRSQPTVW